METLDLVLTSTEYPPFPLAGEGMFAWNYATKCLKNHNVTMVALWVKGAKEYEQIDNLTIRRVKTPLGNLCHNPKQNKSFIDRRAIFGMVLNKYLNKNLKLNEYDLLHNLGCLHSSFLDYKKINKQLPTVCSINEYFCLISTLNPFKFHYTSSHAFFRYFHHNIVKQIELRALRKSTHIIPNCFYISNLLTEKFNIPPEKMSVVHRGINLSRFNVKPSPNKYKSKKVLFIGANIERKGAMDLIKAAPIVLKEYPNTEFIIIGNAAPEYRQKINDFLVKHNIKKNFKFINKVGNEQTVKYYKEANVFVMPTLMEALGCVFMEAMAARTPVVGTNIGGVPELIKDSKNGLLVNLHSPEQIADCIIKVLEKPDFAQKLGEAGRKYVLEHHNLEIMTKKLVRIYKNLL